MAELAVDMGLVRLLQLASPALPVGMYSYSQGMEKAVEDGWIASDADANQWIAGLLQNCLARVDLPILARLYDAWRSIDADGVEVWSKQLLAWRETAELRAEDRQTGQALARLLYEMGFAAAGLWAKHPSATFATAFALAGVSFGIDRDKVLAGYVWGWLENQVLCAVKLVPLGQVAGQKLLFQLAANIPDAAAAALLLADEEIGGSAFGLALASSRHEMQYSRLFRS